MRVCCVFLKLGCVTQSATTVCLLMVLAFPFELTGTKLGLGNLKGEWCASTWMTGGVIEAVTVWQSESGDAQLTSNCCRCHWGQDTCPVSSDSYFWLLCMCHPVPMPYTLLQKSPTQSTPCRWSPLKHPTSFLVTSIHSTCDPVCQLLNNMIRAQPDRTKHLIFAAAVFLNLIFIHLYLSHL